MSKPMILHRQMQRATQTPATRGEAEDADCNEFEFVASSGAPVQTYAGAEYLRIGGMDLKRFRKNPIILDSHKRFSCDDVIGTATVRKEAGQLLAKIRFASDRKSQRIAQKVRDGILNAVSIGFSVDPESVRELEDGETDGDGDDEIKGPGVVLGRSCLHEISMVPVPADEDALRRELYQRCQVKYTEIPAPEAPQADPATEQETQGDESREAALDETLDAETEAAEVKEAKERTAEREARHTEIRGICPSSLSEFLDGVLLEKPDISFEDARRAMLDERTRTRKPVGTPDIKPTKPAPETNDTGALFNSITGS